MPKHLAPETVLMCSLRFWGGAGSGASTTPTLRSGVRHVARRQGVSPRELDRAERSLVRQGYISKRSDGAAALALTERGLKFSRDLCRGVELPPWDWKATYRSGMLTGARRRRRK